MTAILFHYFLRTIIHMCPYVLSLSSWWTAWSRTLRDVWGLEVQLQALRISQPVTLSVRKLFSQGRTSWCLSVRRMGDSQTALTLWWTETCVVHYAGRPASGTGALPTEPFRLPVLRVPCSQSDWTFRYIRLLGKCRHPHFWQDPHM
jgi:hypothetical protein